MASWKLAEYYRGESNRSQVQQRERLRETFGCRWLMLPLVDSGHSYKGYLYCTRKRGYRLIPFASISGMPLPVLTTITRFYHSI